MTRGRVIAAVVAAAVLATLLVLVGFDVPHGVLAGIGVVVALQVLAHLGLGQRVALPRLPFGRRDGTRTEVSSLSWSLHGGSDGVAPSAQRQLRRVAITALGEAGVALDDDEGRRRAVELLGAPMTDFLLDRQTRPLDARAVRAAVLRLEKLQEPR